MTNPFKSTGEKLLNNPVYEVRKAPRGYLKWGILAILVIAVIIIFLSAK